MCIFYGSNEELTYNSQEHIFPATIGGIVKLPKGYVSDQANKYFSKLESELVTNSILGFEKMFYGPGDRGKDKPGRMPITLLQTPNSEELGFTYKGIPITIPQIVIEKNNQHVHVIRDNFYQTNADLDKLLKKINEFNSASKYTLLNVNLEQSKFIIAYYNNNLYIAIKEKDKINSFVEFIKNQMIHKIDYGTAVEQDIVQPKVPVKMTIDIDTNSRVFAKTALNVIACIKGDNYVNNNAFDKIKQCIIGKEDNIYKQFPCSFDITKFINIDDKVHHCSLMNVKDKFCARVTFYNHWSMNFELSKRFDDYFNTPYVYICDWRNKKEFSLVDLLISSPS